MRVPSCATPTSVSQVARYADAWRPKRFCGVTMSSASCPASRSACDQRARDHQVAAFGQRRARRDDGDLLLPCPASGAPTGAAPASPARRGTGCPRTPPSRRSARTRLLLRDRHAPTRVPWYGKPGSSSANADARRGVRRRGPPLAAPAAARPSRRCLHGRRSPASRSSGRSRLDRLDQELGRRPARAPRSSCLLAGVGVVVEEVELEPVAVAGSPNHTRAAVRLAC